MTPRGEQAVPHKNLGYQRMDNVKVLEKKRFRCNVINDSDGDDDVDDDSDDGDDEDDEDDDDNGDGDDGS